MYFETSDNWFLEWHFNPPLIYLTSNLPMENKLICSLEYTAIKSLLWFDFDFDFGKHVLWDILYDPFTDLNWGRGHHLRIYIKINRINTKAERKNITDIIFFVSFISYLCWQPKISTIYVVRELLGLKVRLAQDTIERERLRYPLAMVNSKRTH